MLTDDKVKQQEYLQEILNQYIGTNELPGILSHLSELEQISTKKVAVIYNNLGAILLKLYDKKISFNELKSELVKIWNENKVTIHSDPIQEEENLAIIQKIFILAKQHNEDNNFAMADSYNGLKNVYERQIQLVTEETQKENLRECISKNKEERDKINERLNRTVKYENSSEENNVDKSNDIPITQPEILEIMKESQILAENLISDEISISGNFAGWNPFS
ncbi:MULTISPECIES: hypothetical protein [unclassified Rickettsia]|uniref:hypothetical protein n=1 Tax=unclassified Rickettsia TaxID=114295 RepID=UPI003132DE08